MCVLIAQHTLPVALRCSAFIVISVPCSRLFPCPGSISSAPHRFPVDSRTCPLHLYSFSSPLPFPAVVLSYIPSRYQLVASYDKFANFSFRRLP